MLWLNQCLLVYIPVLQGGHGVQIHQILQVWLEVVETGLDKVRVVGKHLLSVLQLHRLRSQRVEESVNKEVMILQCDWSVMIEYWTVIGQYRDETLKFNIILAYPDD